MRASFVASEKEERWICHLESSDEDRDVSEATRSPLPSPCRDAFFPGVTDKKGDKGQPSGTYSDAFGTCEGEEAALFGVGGTVTVGATWALAKALCEKETEAVNRQPCRSARNLLTCEGEEEPSQTRPACYFAPLKIKGQRKVDGWRGSFPRDGERGIVFR